MRTFFLKSTKYRRLIAILLVFGLVLGAYQEASAKFWGKEDEEVSGYSSTPDGSQCFKLVIVHQYVFWIEVDSWPEQREIPCPN